MNDLKSFLQETEHSHVKIGFTDMDGIIRGKYIAKSKCLSALEKGVSFCDVIVGWDCNDQLYEKAKATGWHTGYPDTRLRIVPESVRQLSLEENMPFFLCEFDGPGAAVCPRRLLGRVLDRLATAGFTAFVGAEYEFFLFNETPDSVRTKDYRNLQTLTPGYFGYSVLRSTVHAELHSELVRLCEDMGMPLEGLHTETGPGVIEAALTFDKAMRAADNASLFKTFVKAFAQRRSLMASFMARWSDRWPGQSGHMHLSLRSPSGDCIFHDNRAESNISRHMRHFIGGMQRLLPELTCMVAPTINSYARLVPGFWAPTNACWGIENRTAAIRAIPGEPSAQRVELRVAGADANPYLALSAALASGAWGIENEIEPTPPLIGSAYDIEPDPDLKLPRTLLDAANRFGSSRAARDLFGDTFVDHFAHTREWEALEFQKHVTDWELARYFEAI